MTAKALIYDCRERTEHGYPSVMFFDKEIAKRLRPHRGEDDVAYVHIDKYLKDITVLQEEVDRLRNLFINEKVGVV